MKENKINKGAFFEKMKNNKGITLIALVVTIVILLILAGVSIGMLAGENGIIRKAQESKDESGKASVIEKAQTDILGVQTENYGKLTKAKFIEVLSKYFEESTIPSEADLPDDMSTATQEITANEENGGYIIKISDIWNGKFETNSVAMITFYIDETEYQAEAGMTWLEWLETDYNIDRKFYNRNNKIEMAPIFIVTKFSETGSYSYVKADSKIEAREYGLKSAAECVYPDSEILIGINGKTVLAKEVEENQEIVYFDFEENTTKTGKVEKVFIHKDATNFVKYTFKDGTYLKATDYHPIYTSEGWKSQTERNGYEKPEIGNKVKTPEGWKEITKIETYTGIEDCYDFKIISEDGEIVKNYFANGTLVEGSY